MPGTKGDASQDLPSRDGAIDRALEYLFTSSGASLESFHLSRLNAVANLRKELHEILDEWVEAEVQARLAQGLLARKNSENLAAAGSITIGSGENRNPNHPRKFLIRPINATLTNITYSLAEVFNRGAGIVVAADEAENVGTRMWGDSCVEKQM
jgi:hypothetical protein